jgi:hypothetical protein
MLRLNGWQRIGIVLSVLWFVIGGLWINSLVLDSMGASAMAEHRRCLDAVTAVPNDSSWDEACGKKFRATYSTAVADHWTYAVVYTLIPIPIVWLLVYGVVVLVRWIGAGFALSRRRRT